VEAARRAPAPSPLSWHRAAGVAFDSRVTWVFDLFERLADQELETL